MKKYSNNELNKILKELNNGVDYCAIANGYGVGHIWVYNNFIFWRHYGQSAQKNNVAELKWLIENIFSDCELITPCEYSEYHIGYIPKDKQFNGFDHSTQHPNAYGL